MLDCTTLRRPMPKGRKAGRANAGGNSLRPSECLTSVPAAWNFASTGGMNWPGLCDAVARVFALPERPLRIVAVEALAGGATAKRFIPRV